MGRIQTSLVLFVVLLLVILGPLSVTGWLSNPAVLGLVLIGLLISSAILAQYHSTRDAEATGFWNSIPDWQYEGRFAEVGGLSKDEQGTAIGKVHERAEEIEKVHDRK